MLISDYLSTKEFIETIIKILNDLDEKINDYKNKNSLYEFQDIALKAIELVEKFPQVREEIKNSTFEIMIDEYQDTNDIQEKFISYIANNNVYMVGDINSQYIVSAMLIHIYSKKNMMPTRTVKMVLKLT